MEIYFYCTYQHSVKGFFTTKLSETGLEPVSLSASDKKQDLFLDRFFSYDSFKVLWCDVPTDDSTTFKVKPEFSVFGLKKFTGTMSDRKWYFNFAIIADKSEIPTLDKIAFGVLKDINGFVRETIECLSVGEKGRYEIDVQKFKKLLYEKASEQEKIPFVSFYPTYRTIRDTLKFCVLTNSWELISDFFGKSFLWKIKPKQAIELEQYEEHFDT